MKYIFNERRCNKMINKEKCRKRQYRNGKAKKDVISIRVNEQTKKFLKENKYVPSQIFYEALREIEYIE
jgi:hypothetical protein